MKEFVVVGGGIHGTYLTNRLLDYHAPEALAIVDPNSRLVAAFERRARACGMTELRSPFVHHLGRDPFDLETFAEGSGRVDELRPTPNYPARPALDLFCDHAGHVIERRSIDDLHVRAHARRVRSTGRGLAVETTDGTLRTRNVALAVGPGCPSLPAWACDGVEHVWGDALESAPERPIRLTDGGVSDETCLVIGGGITAAQVALAVGATALLTRHPLCTAVTEADPPWVNWPHIAKRLHCHPPGSRARLETVRAERHDASMLPGLRDALVESDTAVEHGVVTSALSAGDGVVLRLDDGRTLEADRAVCATGFDPAWKRPFVDAVATDLGLERGYDGVPILDDATLRWRGDTDGVYVTGSLAMCTVGPFAGNVIGARRAADRILGEA